jgi:transposase-like protein
MADKPDEPHDKKKTVSYQPGTDCPFCLSGSTLPVDHKKSTGEKSFYLCLVCGQTFEYVKLPDSGNINSE